MGFLVGVVFLVNFGCIVPSLVPGVLILLGVPIDRRVGNCVVREYVLCVR